MVEYEIEYTRVTAGNAPLYIPWGIVKAAMPPALAPLRRVRLHEVDGSHAYNVNRGKRRGLVIYGR